MSEVDTDPVAAFAARRKRTALIGLAMFLGGIGLFVALMGSITRDMAGPAVPLGELELSEEKTALTFELTEPAVVSLWIEVEQRRTTPIRTTGNPENAADVRVWIDGREQRCATTDVVAYGVLERTGRTDRWVGALSDCEAGRLEAGSHELRAAVVPLKPDSIELGRVVLTPSIDE